MSMKYLGTTLDVHGGGLDLQFPHHENELAQSESYTGKPFSRYWMHNGLMKMGNTKMAGSVGNVVNVVDLLKQHQPETVRFLLLGTHYRSPIEWSDERLYQTQRSLERSFYRFFDRFKKITGTSFYDLEAPTVEGNSRLMSAPTERHPRDLDVFVKYANNFLKEMNEDFNTAGAIGWLHSLVPWLSHFATQHELESAGANSLALAEFR